MNFGTKVRTILAVIMLINEALVRVGTVDFGNETSNQIYRWVSFGFLVAAYVASHWYNNDFTPEACIGTGIARQLKAEKKEGYVGDYFFSNEEEEKVDDDIIDEPVFGELGEAIEQEAEDAQDDI